MIAINCTAVIHLLFIYTILLLLMNLTYIVPVVELVASLLQSWFQLLQKSSFLLLSDEVRPHLHLGAEAFHELPARPRYHLILERQHQAAAGVGSPAAEVTSCLVGSFQRYKQHFHPQVRETTQTFRTVLFSCSFW